MIMKCKQCEKEIPEDAKFCPFCGEKTEEAKPQETGVSQWLKAINERNERHSANSALIMGVLALIGGFIGGFLFIGSLILGVSAVIIGKRHYTLYGRKSLWSTIFGCVGIFLAVIKGYGLYCDYQFAERASASYESELNLPIPNQFPINHDVSAELYPSIYPDYIIEFDYLLDSEDNEKLLNHINQDDRWHALPLDESFKDDFSLILPDKGYYMCYNRKTMGTELPTDNTSYDFVLAVYNETDDNLIILDLRR
jgi:hypothetical protein